MTGFRPMMSESHPNKINVGVAMSNAAPTM
jgi:hypothetical protein